MILDRAELKASAQQALSKLRIAADGDAVWRLFVDLGWPLITVPEELGGLGQGLPAACALYTELGRKLAPTPYLPAMLAAEAMWHGDQADRETWIGLIAAGGYVAVPLGRTDFRIEPEPSGHLRLSGAATAVPSVDKARHLLIWTADDNCVAFANCDHPGMRIQFRPTWDGTRELFDVRCSDVELQEMLVLAEGPAARSLKQRLDMHRDFALAADSIGGSEALLESTVDYLQTRRQFGRPLAMFQALKHRCADLKVLLSAAEALLLDRLDRLSDGDEADREWGKAVKYLACTAYSKIAEEALQLHGGIGITAEHSCHLFLKRALLNEQLGSHGDFLAPRDA